MKRFKIVDFWISVLLITGFTLFLAYDFTSECLFTSYYAIGCWQLVSLFVHLLMKWFTQKGTPRFLYQITVAFILCIALSGLVVKEIMGPLAIVMFFLAPVMAIYYTVICHMEIHTIMKRPLDALK